MCGIAGFCNFEEDFTREEARWTKTLQTMRTTLAHRGSDQTGEYLRPQIGLAHTRLSIRDLGGGRQPMVRRDDGFDYAIVYNGEIYNEDELSGELRQLGVQFSTTCDTEVILYAYLKWGRDFVCRLNGIFAFAIWDGRAQQLVLGRDQVGVKPLFYTLAGSTLVFGSEIKALFAHPLVTPQADDDSFREIFAIGPARTAGCGVFRGICELKPGCLAVYDRTGFAQRPYWALKAAVHTESYADTVEHVSYLVRDAICRQMVSDVPVCSFLSGGLDSSIVTAVASGVLQRAGKTLNTFSFDFTGNDRYFQASSFQPSRDRPYVELMVNSLPVNHTYLDCEEHRLADLLSDALRAKDLPGMTDIDASLLYFCSLVKRQNKVALTGECADEIFGGYPWFYREELLNADGFPWSHDLSARTALLRDDVIRRLNLEEYSHTRYEQSLSEVPRLAGESPREARRREVSYLNLRWLMTTLLDRMDRASMNCGLEARVPFADHRIVEYLYNVPWEMKYRNGVEKALLRDACRDLLLPELLNRKKSPYPKTYDPHYEAILARRLEDVLHQPDAPVLRFADPAKIRRFLQAPKDYGKPWFGQLMAGPQMMAYLLQVNEWLVRYQLG